MPLDKNNPLNKEIARIRALPNPRRYYWPLNWPKREDGSVMSPKRCHAKKDWFARLRAERKLRWAALNCAAGPV